MQQQPGVGRIAHYVARGSADRRIACRAAIITELGENGTVGLAELNPTGLFFHPLAAGGAPYDEDQAPGSWHWPERV